MTPGDQDRIGKLEERMATLMAQMDEARRQITILGTLPVQFAELATSVLNLKDDIGDITKALKANADAEVDRAREDKKDRQSVRVALYGLTGVILAALITACAAIIVARIGATP